VAIVEKAPFPRRKVCGEFISAGRLSLLARTGTAPDVLAQGGPKCAKAVCMPDGT
jgi:hypothetical protein